MLCDLGKKACKANGNTLDRHLCEGGGSLRLYIEDHRQPTATLLLDVVVRRVVRDVAMHQPLAGHACLPDDIVALAGTDIDGIGIVASISREQVAVHRD